MTYTNADFTITETAITFNEKIEGVELEAELREEGWWVSDGYTTVTVETQEVALALLIEWAEDAAIA